MGMTDLYWKTAAEAGAMLRKGDVTSVELTEATLARIITTEPIVHAYASLMTDSALAAARAADRDFAAGVDRGPLQGIPVAVKDLLRTAGHPTSAGSRVIEGYIPDDDAVVVAKLRAGGAVI